MEPLLVTTRPATEADLPFLLRLRLENAGSHSAHAGEALDEAQHLDRLRHRFESAEVLLLDGTAVGMIKLLRGVQAWEILQFQVSASVQRRGVGRAVLAQVVARAHAARVALAACVRKDNPARHLYASMGLRVVGEDALEFQVRRDCS